MNQKNLQNEAGPKNTEKTDEIRDTLIQSIAENMDLYGIPDTVGRLYGTLFFSNDPLTLDEMREALGMSKTSMSNGVRALLETKMVRKVWRKGERKDLYVTEDDWYKTFFDYFSSKWMDAIEKNLKAIVKARDEFHKILEDSNFNDTTIENDLAKLNSMEGYYIWLKRLIHTFETEKIFELVPKPNPSTEKK